MKNNKTAVILFNLGGPDKKEAIKPFLFNLFNDKAIISLPQPFRFLLAKLISSKREKTAAEIYSNLGDKSPILEITQNQADELEKELSFHGDFKTFIAMRYWKPFAKEVVAKVKDYDPGQIILLPLYPQFSTATSESSVDEFISELEKQGLNVNRKISQSQQSGLFGAKKLEITSDGAINLKTICCYPDQEDFILSHAKLIKNKILQKEFEFDKLRILFSAHGLPQKIVDSGDPYVFQVKRTANLVQKKLEELLKKEGIFDQEFKNGKTIDSKVCFQSKVGPLKWTSPSLDHELNRLSLDKKQPIIVPIAFVSEHSETLVELDIEYKEMAEELGIENYTRVQALNSDGHFIKSLVNMTLQTSKNKEFGFFANGKCQRICDKKFKRCIQ